MPAKSLITLRNQASQQLGIDPAFKEVGSGRCAEPVNNGCARPGAGPIKIVHLRNSRNVETKLKSEF
jgi:hypothetical protein